MFAAAVSSIGLLQRLVELAGHEHRMAWGVQDADSEGRCVAGGEAPEHGVGRAGEGIGGVCGDVRLDEPLGCALDAPTVQMHPQGISLGPCRLGAPLPCAVDADLAPEQALPYLSDP